MNNYKIHWRFCLSNWLAHTFPDSIKVGVADVFAKNASEAKRTFREMGYHDVTEGKNGYFRINNIEG